MYAWELSPEAELMRTIRAELHALTNPSIDQLADLIERLKPAVEHPELLLAAQARQLELRLLGALWTEQAAVLRRLGEQLQRLAHWLPPERVDQN